MEKQPLIPILNEGDIRIAVALASSVLEAQETLFIRQSLLSDRQWAAVPQPLDDEAEGARSARIADVIASTGHPECLAVCVSDESGNAINQRHYLVSTTPAGISALMRVRAHVIPYVLVPRDLSFVLAFCDEIYLAAGPRGFVEAVLATDIGKARQRFERFVAQWSDYLGGPASYLIAVKDHYSGFDGIVGVAKP